MISFTIYHTYIRVSYKNQLQLILDISLDKSMPQRLLFRSLLNEIVSLLNVRQVKLLASLKATFDVPEPQHYQRSVFCA